MAYLEREYKGKLTLQGAKYFVVIDMRYAMKMDKDCGGAIHLTTIPEGGGPSTNRMWLTPLSPDESMNVPNPRSPWYGHCGGPRAQEAAHDGRY